MGLSIYFEGEDSTSVVLVGGEGPWKKFHLLIFFSSFAREYPRGKFKTLFQSELL